MRNVWDYVMWLTRQRIRVIYIACYGYLRELQRRQTHKYPWYKWKLWRSIEGVSIYSRNVNILIIKKKKKSILHCRFIKWNTWITIASNNANKKEETNACKIESYISYNVKTFKHAYNFHWNLFFFRKFSSIFLCYDTKGILLPPQVALVAVFRI